MKRIGLAIVLGTLCASLAGLVVAQLRAGSLRGQVLDELGGAIVGASVTVIDSAGVEKSVVTNNAGSYTINGLAPGKYTVRAINAGFAMSETPDVEITSTRPVQLDITLKVAIEEQKVTIAADNRELSTEPENNAGAVVLKGDDIDALPDDPDDLAAALQALAGPSAGPNGGQIFVDGFTGGRLPPRASIREIRINSNPFFSGIRSPRFWSNRGSDSPGHRSLSGSGFVQLQRRCAEFSQPVFTVSETAADSNAPVWWKLRWTTFAKESVVLHRFRQARH
jgi:hypothetical protein